jgi:protein-tyrosine phosphatase
VNPPSASSVLFLCTGNYYRSRYAEILFNELARNAGLPWTADSRGLAPEFGIFHRDAISRWVVRALRERGIECPTFERHPLKVTIEDLQRAHLVIALKEAEHRPLLSQRFAGWEDRVEYWHVDDIDAAPVPDALARIDHEIERLINRLRQR